jgi:hypothetical protein
MRVSHIQLKKALVLSLVFSFLVTLFPYSSAQAAKVTFKQSILPVHFVYLNKGGAVKRIWSNVTDEDSVYVVKYFDDKSQQEIAPSKKAIEKYHDMVQAGDVETSEPKHKPVIVSAEHTDGISVELRTNADVMEEIRTKL